MSHLYIIPTPIGNLEDITLRALRVLREEVDHIFCEDTRVTIKLLNHYEIKDKKLTSCNKENEAKRVVQILDLLDQGKNVALLSDAGTPLISDPGFAIVSAIHQHNDELGIDANPLHPRDLSHQIVPLPGASSLTTTLSVCPMDTSRFIFEGFLPHGPKQRRRVLRALFKETMNTIEAESKLRPIVFFESPHRILKTLEDIQNVFYSDDLSLKLEVFIAREISKKFEEFYYGSPEELLAQLKEQFPKDVQGEFVLLLGFKS